MANYFGLFISTLYIKDKISKNIIMEKSSFLRTFTLVTSQTKCILMVYSIYVYNLYCGTLLNIVSL